MRVGRDREDRAQIRHLSQQLTLELVNPQVEAPGVCRYCSTWTSDVVSAAAVALSGMVEGHRDCASGCPGSLPILCENCVEVWEVLDREPLVVSVISLYRKPSALREMLTRYKGRGEDDGFDPVCLGMVRSILGRYFLDHGDSLVEVAGGVDGIVVVPSTDRLPPHPLEALVDSLNLDLPRLPLLERDTGVLGFRQPNSHAYRVVGTRKPSRTLLIDDVYTTGSRINSAAAALDRDGHRTVAALVLARRINTGYAPEALRLWTGATARPFDWRTSPRTVAA